MYHIPHAVPVQTTSYTNLYCHAHRHKTSPVRLLSSVWLYLLGERKHLILHAHELSQQVEAICERDGT